MGSTCRSGGHKLQEIYCLNCDTIRGECGFFITQLARHFTFPWVREFEYGASIHRRPSETDLHQSRQAETNSHLSCQLNHIVFNIHHTAPCLAAASGRRQTRPGNRFDSSHTTQPMRYRGACGEMPISI
ncbi:hypothetical protein BaRGS_00011605 [Batillaria attramentaria]|uniref:Uncharacterized protein n=1 Tax=Batillaria attramentaria TaxID=370345 RepID=A0ABD0LCG0_9CAEN